MKKLLILSLAVVMAFSACACAKDSKKSASSSSTYTPTGNFDYVPQYASNGEFTGLDVHIGMSMDELKALYKGTATSSATAVDAYNFTEFPAKNGMIKMICMNYYFYFTENAKDKGVSAIANLGDAYGLQNGISTTNDVKSVCGESQSYTPESSELFFLPAAPENCTALSYEYGNYTIKFFFSSDYLTATFLYNNTVFQYPAAVK